MFKSLLTLIPTLLFILIMLWGFLLGLKRGFRKSLILLIQALIAFAIALTFYLVIVNLKESDEMIVKITNNFMGTNGLQNALGVSTSNTTLSDMLTEFIIKKLDYGTGVQLALEENANYIATLVSFAYHVVFFFVALLLYDILLFLFYLIYVIFYPERRHKVKMEKKEKEDGSNYVYKKRHLLGSIIGLGRGFVKAIFVMSFVGAFLFLIGGGIGDNKYTEEVEIKDPIRSKIYNVYEALGSYGSSGIFKILNTIKDKNEVPYYFFIANTVFSGKFEDPNLGTNKNVYFVREVGEYTRFVRSTLDLMMKYDKETMVAVINGEIEVGDDKVFAIFGNSEFQEEFTKLIDLVESDTYIINFSLSMVDSIAHHFEDTSMAENVDDKTREIIKILLVDNYYSSYIPDDAQAKAANKKVDTLTLSQILTRDDIKELSKGLLSILSIPKDTPQNDRIFLYNEYLVPQLKKLSILNIPERKQEVNGVFERLFVALENMYENNQQSQLTVEKLNLVADVSVDWAGEIGNLLDSIYNLGILVDNVYEGDNDILGAITRIFDKTRSDYVENITAYDNIATSLEKSKVLDKILNIQPVYDGFMSMLTSMYSDVYVPNNIVFGNGIDSDGYGELHWFLNAFKALMIDEDNAKIIPRIIESARSGSDSIMSDLIDLCDNIADDGNNEGSVLWYISKSQVLQVVLSSLVFANQNVSSEFAIYIPDSARLYVDNEYKNLITMEELTNVINVIPGFLTDMLQFVDENDEHYGDYDFIIQSIKNHGSLMYESDIIEATIANIIINKFEDSDVIAIPSTLNTPEEWLEANDGKGELRSIVDAVLELGLTITNIDVNQIADKVAELNGTSKLDSSKTKLDVIMDSKLIYLTFSKTLDKYITTSLVQEEAKTLSKTLIDGDQYYKKEELRALIDVVYDLAINISNIDIENIVSNIGALNDESAVDSSKTKLDVMYDSILIKSMVYTELVKLINSNDIIVDHPNAKAKEYEVLNIYKKSEISELIAFIISIGSPALGNISLENIALTDNSIDSICKSEILKATLSKNLIDKDILVITKDDYDFDNNYIDGNALKELLLSVKDGLGIANAEAFSIDSVKLPASDKIDALLDSSIMLSTISKKVSAGEGNDVYVASAQASIAKTYDDVDFVLVSKTEIKAFIEGIGTLAKDGGYEVEINNSKLHELALDSSTFDKAMNSSILHIIISQFVLQAYSATPTVPVDVMDVTRVIEINNFNVVSEATIRTVATTLMS